ncbi:hypothetical protein [Roseivivax isoporae]|uniref:Uracil-DNA glycosylase-like domain-containing protein n=1 Tax=Roseivivax isoporae LMG 25204 TaxID=1449351 RepID=X7FB03_9RHOB|nr:hypothetical protein [Roseivivax isoporae]ETX29965.1 hypothetical protein RISW2_20160 [Roseivivax isoporae LMG 25204]
MSLARQAPCSRARAYRDAVARRRAFALPGYETLAEAGFDGDYVSPIQMSSGNLYGPMILSKDWLDAPSARAHRRRLALAGYLPETPFNRVLDRALALAGLTRADIYVAPVFCLLPPVRSHRLPLADARASFEAVTGFELMGRRPVAAGTDAQRVLRAAGVAHVPTIHPSARGLPFEDRAVRIARALEAA